ncbi:hypothetical protein LEN26_017260 [Aphanomyces euteiches]|nr:hypothetical protein LEN26_017260 [Aphanomyces euteiches]KAH9103958.1 hypothetical protein AeMF1_019838 [Aphanomyces euteiches]KAH9186445.1 hypothetical protein AeNC1_011579 [Aphanomyces euteiches]
MLQPKRGYVQRWLRTLKTVLLKPRMRGETFRKWVNRNLENSPLAALIDTFQVILGLGVTMIYFYQNWTKFQDVPETIALRNLQIVIGLFFTVDYLARLYAADSRSTFVVSTMSLIDLGTIIPQWLELIIADNSRLKGQASSLKTLRALRFLRAFRLLSLTKTAKGRQGGILFLTVVAIIFCSAGIFQALEKCDYPDQPNCQTLEMYNACYLVVITIATLGYGDLAPKSDNAKVVVIVLIGFTGVFLPLQISRFSDILNRETEYDQAFTLQKEKHPHILICGEVNSGALDFFLRQFLHPDNFNWKDKVVILCPGLPSHNLRRILLSPAYEARVMYLQGSAMLDSDLKRAAAANARMCFVLLNKFSPDGDRNDTASNLLTISLRHHTEDVPIFVQVLKTDNIRHVQMSGATNILCIDELKMGILAKACIVPGFCALISNIIFTLRAQSARSHLWASEYLDGCATMLCRARLPAYLDGCLSFSTLVRILYKEYNMLTIATTGKQHLDMQLFPSKLVLKSFHKLLILTTNPDDANKVDNLSLSVLQKYSDLIPAMDRINDRWNANSLRGKIRSRSSTLMSNVSNMSSRTINSGMLPMHSPKTTAVRRVSVGHVIPCDDDTADSSHVGSKTMVSQFIDKKQPVHPATTHTESPVVALTTPQPRLPDLHVIDPRTAAFGRDLSQHSCSNEMEGEDQFPTNFETTSVPSHTTYASFLDNALPHDLHNHIVLLGMPNKLHDFVAPLRHLETGFQNSTKAVLCVPIVVVALLPMTEKQHASIASFERVYYLHGSPLNETVLREANVFTAKSIVILTNCMQTSFHHEHEDHDIIDLNMIDTDAITLHRFVTEACENVCPAGCPRPTVIIELNRPSSMRFLKDELLRAEPPPVAQAVKALTRKVLSRADDPLDNICHPLYASGKVFISNSLDAMLGSCDRYGSTLDLVQLLTFGEEREGGRVVDLIDLPSGYMDKEFRDLFEYLLRQKDILALGLYRARQKRHSYVFMNPFEGAIVREADKVFVLR